MRTECGFSPREEGVLYIFCGTRNDRLKALVFEGDGFVLLTKRLLNGMEFKWPRSRTQALEIPAETYMELMNGCELESSIPYSESGAGTEVGANIDASLAGIGAYGAREAPGDAGMQTEEDVPPSGAADVLHDDRNAGLHGTDDPGQVTQGMVAPGSPVPEMEGILAKAGVGRPEITAGDRRKSEPERASPHSV